MTFTLPATTRAILDAIEAARQPIVDYEVAHPLFGLHNADGLSDAERKGAWAEASAFNFRLSDGSPWGTDYGPIFTTAREDGTLFCAPDSASTAPPRTPSS